MKKSFTLIFLVGTMLMSMVAATQTPVDYKSIYERMTDETSDQYYPKLLKRFSSGDESLTTEDYRVLYYGFTFQEAYRPYDRNPLDKEISDIMAQGLNEETTPLLISKSKEYLAENPFSLKMNYYLQNFLNGQDEEELKSLLIQQHNGIIKAILSSGDGKTQESGYSVNNPSDEYMVLRHLNLTPKEHRFETTSDYFSVAENENDIEGIYFDVYQMAKVGTKQIGVETIEVEDDEIPEDGIEIGSVEEMEAFIPAGYNIIQDIKADIDGDKDLDWILALAKEGEELLSNAASDDPEPRLFILLQRNDKGLLTQTVESDSLIPCIDCGGSDKDPFIALNFEDGLLSMYTTGGNLFVWERKSTFTWKEDNFYLQEEEFSSYRKGKKDQAQTELETSEDFGKVSITEFNFYDSIQ